MGSFAGHLLPGIFFTFYGLYWAFMSFWVHLTTPRQPTKAKSGGASVSFATFKRESELAKKSYIPQPFCQKIPVEPLIKFILSVLGMIAEGFVGVDQKTGNLFVAVYQVKDANGNFNNQSKLHHITMYLAFALSGLIDLLSLFIRLPKHTSKLFFTIAFVIELLLFWFHAEARADLDKMVHLLLNYTILLCVLFAALRMWQPVNVLINAGLSFGIILQGIWFIQLGSILYIQKWELSDHNSIMFAIATYSWYLLGVMVVMLVLYIALLGCFRGSRRYRRSRRKGLKFFSSLPETLVANHSTFDENDDVEGKELISKHSEIVVEETQA